MWTCERVPELPLPPLCDVCFLFQFFFSSSSFSSFFYPFELCWLCHSRACTISCRRVFTSTYNTIGTTHTHSFLGPFDEYASLLVFLPSTWSRCLLGMFSLATLNWAWIPSVISFYFICLYAMHISFPHTLRISFFFFRFSAFFAFVLIFSLCAYGWAHLFLHKTKAIEHLPTIKQKKEGKKKINNELITCLLRAYTQLQIQTWTIRRARCQAGRHNNDIFHYSSYLIYFYTFT